jgi:hypothetical protein
MPLYSSLMGDARYVEFCQDLVGKKLVLHKGTSNELFVCTGFNPEFGVHRLKSLLHVHTQVSQI